MNFFKRLWIKNTVSDLGRMVEKKRKELAELEELFKIAQAQAVEEWMEAQGFNVDRRKEPLLPPAKTRWRLRREKE